MAKKGKPGRKWTKEEKLQRSLLMKRQYAEGKRTTIPPNQKGKKRSEETCNKISNCRRGIPLSEEHKRKIGMGVRKNGY